MVLPKRRLWAPRWRDEGMVSKEGQEARESAKEVAGCPRDRLCWCDTLMRVSPPAAQQPRPCIIPVPQQALSCFDLKPERNVLNHQTSTQATPDHRRADSGSPPFLLAHHPLCFSHCLAKKSTGRWQWRWIQTWLQEEGTVPSGRVSSWREGTLQKINQPLSGWGREPGHPSRRGRDG